MLFGRLLGVLGVSSMPLGEPTTTYVVIVGYNYGISPQSYGDHFECPNYLYLCHCEALLRSNFAPRPTDAYAHAVITTARRTV